MCVGGGGGGTTAGILQINFAGEGGIDQGGPRREFFRLLGIGLKDTFFRGTDNRKFFAQDVSAIQVCIRRFFLMPNF